MVGIPALDGLASTLATSSLGQISQPFTALELGVFDNSCEYGQWQDMKPKLLRTYQHPRRPRSWRSIGQRPSRGDSNTYAVLFLLDVLHRAILVGPAHRVSFWAGLLDLRRVLQDAQPRAELWKLDQVPDLGDVGRDEAALDDRGARGDHSLRHVAKLSGGVGMDLGGTKASSGARTALVFCVIFSSEHLAVGVSRGQWGVWKGVCIQDRWTFSASRLLRQGLAINGQLELSNMSGRATWPHLEVALDIDPSFLSSSILAFSVRHNILPQALRELASSCARRICASSTASGCLLKSRPRPAPNTDPGDEASDSRVRRRSNDPAQTSSSGGPISQPARLAEGADKPFRPSVREEAVKATVYDIVPTIAAPHSTSINAVTATPDMRWVFSGGADGWIRKFHWPDTVNSKAMLTVAQRHPFVDSVTKAGVLTSYWENEEPSDKTDAPQSNDEGPSLSPVYSLATHHQALWLLSGTEIGAINLQAVRHGEGKRITSMFGHSSAVSVLSLSHDEKSCLSGSWDKTILDWDLNTGQTKRSFTGSGSQISVIDIRPNSTLPVPTDTYNSVTSHQTTAAEKRSAMPVPNGVPPSDGKPAQPDGQGSPIDSLFQDDHDSLFGDDAAGPTSGINFGDDEDDEFSRAMASETQAELADGVDVHNGDPSTTATTNGLDASTAALDAITAPDAPDTSSTSAPADTNGTHTPNAPPSTLPDLSESTFLDAAIDGTLRVWDRRQQNPIARIAPPRSVPPWCMCACWSPDGNFVYAGRRNGVVDEYSLHKGLREPVRTLRFPGGSGPVSALRPMPNGRHLICASYDILRLYDLQDEESAKHSRVPFLIVPGHRTGVVSQLYIDQTCSYMISCGGNRGWDGGSTEVLLGYEIASITR
ncbi:hypothetical protein FH972_026545 [Carpinus fangiana]|uniref:Transcription factor spt8 beta-propeller domain-containing protein n=1 Tax=Carpinus fangiana TaxID=176857 RepID=A0A5N6L4E0_9ROSI|nr:hypothetical protein FH972_026545 [Carpinus fangiana]